MKGKKIASVLMGAALACSLSPIGAFAAQYQNAETSVSQADKVTVQASSSKKATVYVATSVRVVEDDGYSTTSSTTRFNYNKNKLVTRRAQTSRNGGGTSTETTTYGYRGTNLASKAHVTSYGTVPTAYTTTAKGLIKRAVETTPGYFEGKDMIITCNVSYRGGKPSQVTDTVDAWIFQPTGYVENSLNPNDYVLSSKTSTERLYYNKKGLVRAVKGTNADGETSTNRFSYDKQGNVSKVARTYSTYNCANKYDANGNLVKRVITSPTEGATKTCTIKWKKVKVGKALAKKVKKQQWSLVNGDMNMAFCEGVTGVKSGQY